jgi:hypothetical protein
MGIGVEPVKIPVDTSINMAGTAMGFEYTKTEDGV